MSQTSSDDDDDDDDRNVWPTAKNTDVIEA